MTFDALKVAEGLMAAEDELTADPGFAGFQQRRQRRIFDHRIALLIGLDIARTLRSIQWNLDRIAER